jgi:serpin B
MNLTELKKTGLRAFLSDSTEKVLITDDENPIYSPLGLYLTLSMIAETVSDEVRTQILDFFGVESMDVLRENNRNLIGSLGDNAIADEFKLRNFLLRDTKRESFYNQEVVDLLKSNYQAKDYLIDLVNEGPDVMSEAIKNNTNGFLEVSRDVLAPDFDDLLVSILMNILYYKDAWAEVFKEDQIIRKDFYNNGTETVSVDMLCDTRVGAYFENAYFKSGSLRFKNYCRIYFILPRGEYTVADCLKQNAISSIVTGEPNKNQAEIDFQIPKFDVSYNSDLTDYLKAEGLDKAFDFRDDSPFYNGTLGLRFVKQISRIKLDEQGVKAASVTYGGEAPTSMPEEPETMHLDRPFIYVITTTDDVILFSGIINKL